MTPILGSAAPSCTRRQSCTKDKDEANTDDEMTKDSYADDRGVAIFGHLIVGIGFVLILGAALSSGARCGSRSENGSQSFKSKAYYRLFGNEREFLAIKAIARNSLSYPNSLY